MKRSVVTVVALAALICAHAQKPELAEEPSRGEIEAAFIGSLRFADVSRSPFAEVDTAALEPYAGDAYVLPGGTYQNKDITRNVYFTGAERLLPVWDASMPAESLANLFIYPSDVYGPHEIEITVLKHEYGETEVVRMDLDRFLAVCERAGCVPFWGVERMADGKLTGALFLYNSSEGYDHVLKVDCVPEDVIAGSGLLKARASLFIPTGNVHNLYAPYVKKSEKEKISYDGK